MGWLSSFVSSIKSRVSSISHRISSSIKHAISRAKSAVSRAYSYIRSKISRSIHRSSSSVSNARSKIHSSVHNTVSRIRSSVSRAKNTIRHSISHRSSSSSRHVSNAKKLAHTYPDRVIREARKKIREHEEIKKVREEKEKHERFWPDLKLPDIRGLKEAVISAVHTLTHLPGAFASAISERIAGYTIKEFQDPLDRVLSQLGIDPVRFRKLLTRMGIKYHPHSPATAAAIAAVVGALVSMVSGPIWDKSRQLIYSQFPTRMPSASDLVRFELREVFRGPERREQLEEPPSSDFIKHMRKLGFDRYWADSYWAAHWDLPSVTQGFEMYHRLRPGRVPSHLVFTRKDLEKLLKRQDVLKAYRDKLVAIAYNPITRVDIRRMLRMGVIDKKEAEERYKDLGYSPKDAKLLAEYAAREVEPQEKALTKSELIKLYAEGLIKDSELREELSKLGYAGDELERLYRFATLVRQRKYRNEKPKRMLSLSDYEKLFEAGVLSEQEFKQVMVELGYSSAAIEHELRLLDELRKQREEKERARRRRLTLAQMTKAFRLNIITEKQLEDYMRERGYVEEDIKLYLRLIKTPA